MIEIDFDKNTYTCPFCNKAQAYSINNMKQHDAVVRDYSGRQISELSYSAVEIYHIRCTNKSCQYVSVVGRFCESKKQFDILPQNVCRKFPDYIPQQIRDDYEEASCIINNSPKAAATLLRRCLQGMIHDFWNIHAKNLNAEITMLKEKVQSSQWKAIDGLRKIGNVGAHMEHDVNLVIDIDHDEAIKLQKLIELLLEKWYISRHEEELLYSEICGISDEKEKMRK